MGSGSVLLQTIATGPVIIHTVVLSFQTDTRYGVADFAVPRKEMYARFVEINSEMIDCRAFVYPSGSLILMKLNALA